MRLIQQAILYHGFRYLSNGKASLKNRKQTPAIIRQGPVPILFVMLWAEKAGPQLYLTPGPAGRPVTG